MEQMTDYNLIIFDMDGTLYDLHDVHSMNYKMQVDFYSGYSGMPSEKVEELFGRQGILPKISGDARSATEFFSKTGVDMAQWKSYRSSHFDVRRISRDKAVDDRVIRAFHAGYKTVLLTSNSYDNVDKVLKRLGISAAHFDMIVCSDYNYPYETFDKGRAIQYIADRMNIEFSDMLSIGDRYHTDVEPALRSGGAGIVVERPAALEEVYEDLEKREMRQINYIFYDAGNYRPL